MSRDLILDDIWDQLAKLDVDELRVIKSVAGRLATGKKQYGTLDIATDKRNWSKEIAEEILDQAVYASILLLKEGGDEA